jgi:hypothetical protein
LFLNKSCFIFVSETNNMETIIFKHLLAEHKEEVVKQLDSLAKVAKRVGVPAPTWSLGNVYEYEFQSMMDACGYGEDHEEEYETFIEKVFDVTINIEQSIKMEGNWKIAAVMNHETTSFIQIDTEVELPAKYTPKVAICEHCGRNFPRVKSFLIYNDKGEWMQIGKTCMKQFLGINPTSYISMFEAASKFSNFIETLGYRKNRGGRMENLAYNVEDMLRYTIGQVQRDGKFTKAEWKFVPSGYFYRDGEEKMKPVRSNEPDATIDKVRFIINANSRFKFQPSELIYAETLTKDITFYQAEMERLDVRQKELSAIHQSIIDGLKPEPRIGGNLTEEWTQRIESSPEAAEAEIASNEAYAEYCEAKSNFELKTSHNWFLVGHNDLNSNNDIVTQLKEWAAAIQPKMRVDELEGTESYASEFESFKAGIKDTFSRNRVLQTNLKFICSGYNTFITEEAKKVERAAMGNLHVGAVGEKCHLTLKVTGHKSGVGNFGVWHLWTMEDIQRNQFKKFGQLEEKFITHTPEDSKDFIGCTIEALFTIKSHAEYDGMKQTELGRASKPKTTKKTKA